MKVCVRNAMPAVRLWCLLACVLIGPGPSEAIELLVYNNNDSGPGSLRQAIQDNNALGGGNTIIFSNTATGTITLTSGELVITTNATIVGPGPDVLTVSGNNASRIFNVTGGTADILGLSVANGRVAGGTGGGILNVGNLNLTNCLLTANVANSYGGAVYSSGNLMAVRCAFTTNSSQTQFGGALSVGGTTVLDNCTIVSNACYWDGGGIYNFGNLTATSCTIVNNRAVGESDSYGGGIKSSGITLVRNSIIAGNSAPGPSDDVYGPFVTGGYNFIGTADSSTGWGDVGDQFGTTASPINPNLLPLGNYGGPTPTMPPALGSPAIDQGKRFGLTTDQRGRPRPYDDPFVINATLGDGSDIGAVEVGIGINLLVTNSNDSGPGSLRQTVLDASPIEEDVLTFAPSVTNTITLTGGEIVLNKSIEVLGPTNRALTVSGNNSSRAFHVTGGISRIYRLTIANGLASDGGGILADEGHLYLGDCQIVSNATTSVGLETGGGISVRSNASVILYRSSITHNQAYFGGGGIVQSHAAIVSVDSSTIASNRTTYVFGGLLSPQGGGIWIPSGTLFVFNSTIAGNHSTYYGGGICNGVFSSGTVNVSSSIIAANTSVSVGPDAVGPFNSGGYNLVGNASGSTGFTNATDQVGVNPLLGPLGNYGGLTLTMALRSGSPAIDKGVDNADTDQRGFTRLVDDHAIANASGGNGTDIGAYETDPRFRIVNISRVGNDVGLSLITMLGKNYRAEYATDLDSISWPVFTNDAPGNGHLLWITNFGGANQPRRFYRGNSLE